MGNDLDRRILVALQDGLPLSATPYADAAEGLGLTEAELLDRLSALLAAGVIRRMGASLAHRKLGFTANAMVIWQVDEARVERVGRQVAEFEEVTHCYERPPAPGWPCNLYAMVHARTAEQCAATVARIERACGLAGGILAFSRQEFAKTWSRLT